MREREGRKSQTLVMTARGGRGQSYLGVLVRIQVTPRWADDHVRNQEGEEDGGDRTSDDKRRGSGGLISVRNNKRRILGPEWSMSEVGTPSTHNSNKPHGLVDSINNNRCLEGGGLCD